MNLDLRTYEEQYFVEEAALIFEQSGLPRMAGRILGRLLISVPPHQSPNELAESLRASKGSISTSTRLLIQAGLIERTSLPGERRDYFRIKEDVWFDMTKQKLVQMTAFHDLASRGLDILGGKPPELRERLEELWDLCDFYEREFPGLLERWEEQRKERKEKKE